MIKPAYSKHISQFTGYLFLVLPLLKILKLDATTFIDECTSIATILFMGSSVLSFLAIRSSTIKIRPL